MRAASARNGLEDVVSLAVFFFFSFKMRRVRSSQFPILRVHNKETVGRGHCNILSLRKGAKKLLKCIKLVKPRPSKSNFFFARSEFSLIKFCADICAEIAVKTYDF